MRDDLRSRLAQFKAQYPVDPAVQDRVTKPPVEFIGDEILEQGGQSGLAVRPAVL